MAMKNEVPNETEKNRLADKYPMLEGTPTHLLQEIEILADKYPNLEGTPSYLLKEIERLAEQYPKLKGTPTYLLWEIYGLIYIPVVVETDEVVEIDPSCRQWLKYGDSYPWLELSRLVETKYINKKKSMS
jgi:hypothetical protein